MRGDDSFCPLWIEGVWVFVGPSLRNVKCGVGYGGAFGVALGGDAFRIRHDERETLAGGRR